MNNTAVTDQERTARAALTYLAEPGDRVTGAVTRCAGGVGALEAVRSGSLAGITGLSEMPDLKRALERLRGRLGRVPPRDELLRALDDGRFRLACQRSLAVAGSRAATAYGAYLAAEFGASLAGRGLAVIAGGSFGVDAAAHRGALGADGLTIAVTAGGIDLPYPAAHAELFSAVAAQGAIVSEAPPGTLPSRLRFEARSRIIAALATATVVVEAASRSGAVTVARHARDLGRPVMAVPGPVTSGLSAGCHELIRTGRAVLVASANDVIDALPRTCQLAG